MNYFQYSFLEGVFYFCFYIWHLKAILVFRIALRCFLCDFQFVFRNRPIIEYIEKVPNLTDFGTFLFAVMLNGFMPW